MLITGIFSGICEIPSTISTHYVVGIADKKFKRTSLEPENPPAPPKHWDVALARRKLAALPFIGYHRGRFNFYLGWRERGNFGFKLNLSKPPKPTPSSHP